MASSPTPYAGLTLQEWLDASDLTYSALARLIPCSTAYPRMMAQGLSRPSYEMARRIEEISGGAVRRELWYPPSNDDNSQQSKPSNDLDDLL